MSQRAEALADQFEQLSQEMIATIERYSGEQMQSRCAGEQCSCAALASHVAGVHALAADWIQKAAAGQALPEVTMDMNNQANAAQFARDANRNKDEILTDLRQNAADAARVVRTLNDEELDRTTYVPLFEREMTTEELTRYVLIGDIQGHLESIKAAGGAA